MNNPSNTLWQKIASVATFLSVGLPFWRIPYAKVNLPDALLHPGLSVAVTAALLLCMYRIVPWRRAIRTVTVSVVAAVFARTLIEGIQDSTSHNLWPFEIIIATLVGLTFSASGAIAGSLIAHWFRPPFTGNQS